MLMKFLNQIELEVQNIQNRSQRGEISKVGGGAGLQQLESDESKIKE